MTPTSSFYTTHHIHTSEAIYSEAGLTQNWAIYTKYHIYSLNQSVYTIWTSYTRLGRVSGPIPKYTSIYMAGWPSKLSDTSLIHQVYTYTPSIPYLTSIHALGPYEHQVTQLYTCVYNTKYTSYTHIIYTKYVHHIHISYTHHIHQVYIPYTPSIHINGILSYIKRYIMSHIKLA